MKKATEKEAMLQNDQNEEEIQVLEEESTGKRILNTIVNVILVVAIILAALCTYTSYVASSGNGVPSVFGVRMFSIQTQSMYPTLLPGDLIFDTAVKDASELRKGDIITYWTVINGERVLNTHRIDTIYDGGGYLIFATKGDNNTAADALTVHESEIVGRYMFRVGGLGKFFDYLQTSTGFLIVVVVPVFLFFLFHLVQFFRVLFEYQNVKNRIKFEQERGRTEDLIEAQKRAQLEAQAAARAKMEEELRERLRAEIMATMVTQKQPEEPAPAPVVEEPVAEEPPVEVPPVKETPVEAAPVEETPTEEAPAEEAPAEETPAEEAPAEEAPAEETPAEEAPVEETPAEEAPAEEAPAEEAPAEEAPAEEAPAEEAPAEEAPAEEAPAEEAPVEEAPAEEKKPVLDEAAIEALIAKQREAIEAELREKLRAEFMATMNAESKNTNASVEEGNQD